MANSRADYLQMKEVLKFQTSFNKRQIKATWALAIVIIIMFFLEEFFGGSQNISVLVRMGANVSDRVRQGEYFRLFSSVFLHAGMLHVFFNTYVLFALGGFFNKILGELRFLTVFFVSGLCGSLSSVWLGTSTVSVGASGAIWGFFGVSLAISIFKTSLLPEPIRLKLRRVTLINLLINLGISFLPMIDFWAHIGGGIGGFLVGMMIIFQPSNKAISNWFSRFYGLMALLFSIIFAFSIGTALYKYKPWVDQLKVELQEVKLKSPEFIIAIPKGLKEVAGEKNSDKSSYYVFGNPLIDSVVLEVRFLSAQILGHAADEQWLLDQKKMLLKQTSKAADIRKSIYFKENADGGMLYYQQNPKSGNIAIHNFLITKAKYAIKLAIVTGPNVNQKEVEKFAGKILGSIKKY